MEGCKAFMDVYDGHLEELFIKRQNDDDYYQKVCLDHTGVLIEIIVRRVI